MPPGHSTKKYALVLLDNVQCARGTGRVGLEPMMSRTLLGPCPHSPIFCSPVVEAWSTIAHGELLTTVADIMRTAISPTVHLFKPSQLSVQ